jgi:uncharacterized membrane protein YcaP (DUF421 family)
MRTERITIQELDTTLRRHGTTSVDDVRLGVIEPDGEITLILGERNRHPKPRRRP